MFTSPLLALPEEIAARITDDSNVPSPEAPGGTDQMPGCITNDISSKIELRSSQSIHQDNLFPLRT